MFSLELEKKLVNNSPHELSKLKQKKNLYKNIIKLIIYFLIYFTLFCISIIIIYKKNKFNDKINSYNYNIKELTNNIEQINIEMNENLKLNKIYEKDFNELNEKEEIENFILNNLKRELNETKEELFNLKKKLNELNK